MIPLIKSLHFLGMALFLGSIAGHIHLGQGVAPGEAAYGWAQAAKYDSTLLLTIPGLMLTAASGVALAVARRGGPPRRWLRVKVVLTALVGLNGALVLAPLGRRLAEGAVLGASGPMLEGLSRLESLFGAANLLMTLAVIALAVFRPRLGGSA